MDNGPQPVAKEGRGSPLLEWWPAFVRYVPTLTILMAGLWTVVTWTLQYRENAAAEVRWSIDPLDGTVNFTRGLPNFCTSVGAADVQTGEWLVGAIVAPILDLTYYAKRGHGSFVIRNGQHIRLTGPPADRTTKIIATGFSYQADERVAQFENITRMMPDFVDLRRMGAAALDLCAVAEGAIDVYYERGIKEYDWAAGALIAEEAGLTVQRPAFVGDLCHARLTN